MFSLTGNVTDVAITTNFFHGHVGDVIVELSAPGGAPTQTIISRTGTTTSPLNPLGDDSNAGGGYTFTDSASANWWSAADAVLGFQTIPAGSYAASTPGPDGGENTSITPTFTGLADPNGTWTLRYCDAAPTAGGISAGAGGFAVRPSLDITTDGPQCSDGADNDGDGKSDYLAEPGCTDLADDDETDPPGGTQCSDGVDNDGDFASDYPGDTECTDAADDCEAEGPSGCSGPTDTDGDGIPDEDDVEEIQEAVKELPASAFRGGAAAHPKAITSILEEVEAMVGAGDTSGALSKLEVLSRKVDGCGSSADKNDWIIECSAQLEVREMIDTLVANLSS